jgi:hypothetical protein
MPGPVQVPRPAERDGVLRRQGVVSGRINAHDYTLRINSLTQVFTDERRFKTTEMFSALQFTKYP